MRSEYMLHDGDVKVGSLGAISLPGRARLDRLWVHPLYRGRGLSRRLLLQVATDADLEGVALEGRPWGLQDVKDEQADRTLFGEQGIVPTLPVEHLQSMYRSVGFVPVEDGEGFHRWLRQPVQGDTVPVELHEGVPGREAAVSPVKAHLHAVVAETGRTTVYHLTDNPRFKLDETFEPEDNSLSINPRDGRRGLYVGRPERWASPPYNYKRPYVAELSIPTDTKEGGRWGGEDFIPAETFGDARVERVMPYDHYIRREFKEPGETEEHTDKTYDTGEPLRHTPGRWQARYPEDFDVKKQIDTRDPRQWSDEQHADYLAKRRNYLHDVHNWGWNEFDDQHGWRAPEDSDFDGNGEFVRRDRSGQVMNMERRASVHQPVKAHLPWADLQGLSPEQSAFQRTHPAVRTQVLRWMDSMGHHDALGRLVGVHRAQSQVDRIRARQGRPSPYRPAHMAQPYLNPMDQTMRMRAVAARPKKPKIGECYYNAYHALMEAPDGWTMMHGDMLSPLDRRPGGPYPNGHAVLFDPEGNLHDPTMGAEWSNGAWQHVYNFQPGARTFTRDEARKEASDRDGFVGPWHETQTDYDRFGKEASVVNSKPIFDTEMGGPSGKLQKLMDNRDDVDPDPHLSDLYNDAKWHKDYECLVGGRHGFAGGYQPELDENGGVSYHRGGVWTNYLGKRIPVAHVVKPVLAANPERMVDRDPRQEVQYFAVSSIPGDEGDLYRTLQEAADRPKSLANRKVHPGRGMSLASAPDFNVEEWEGEEGNNDHITRTESGTIPIDWVRNMHGARGEIPGDHRNRKGPEWDKFKDALVNGSGERIHAPVFIAVEHGSEPLLYEGNHRRDAYVELGATHVPAFIRYFGHAERQGTVGERHERMHRQATASENSDLADELRDNGGEVNEDGTVTLYHHTSPELAESIYSSGRMHGREDGVFFTTRGDQGSQGAGRGGAVVRLRVPLNALQLDDAFGDEAHVKIPTRRPGDSVDVSSWLHRTAEFTRRQGAWDDSRGEWLYDIDNPNYYMGKDQPPSAFSDGAQPMMMSKRLWDGTEGEGEDVFDSPHYHPSYPACEVCAFGDPTGAPHAPGEGRHHPSYGDHEYSPAGDLLPGVRLAAAPDESGLKAAGIAVIALDTGRVLMQQRALNPLMCPCGMGVTWDEMNGYQHSDGSVSHDDSDMSVSDMLDQGHDVPCDCCLNTGEDDHGSECTSCDGTGANPEPPLCASPCREEENEPDETAALEYDPNEGKWEMPGGKLDPGESPRAAAIREFREEVGQDLPPGVFVGAWLAPGGISVSAATDETADWRNPGGWERWRDSGWHRSLRGEGWPEESSWVPSEQDFKTNVTQPMYTLKSDGAEEHVHGWIPPIDAMEKEWSSHDAEHPLHHEANTPETPQGFKDLEGLGWNVEYRPRLGQHRATLVDEHGAEHHAYYDPYYRGWDVRSSHPSGKKGESYEKTPQAADKRARIVGRALGVDPALGEKSLGVGYNNLNTTNWPVETRSLFDRLSAVESWWEERKPAVPRGTLEDPEDSRLKWYKVVDPDHQELMNPARDPFMELKSMDDAGIPFSPNSQEGETCENCWMENRWAFPQDEDHFKETGHKPVVAPRYIAKIAAKNVPVYKGFIYLIQRESDIDLGKREIANPDDPDGDMSEQSAWWDIEHAKKNPALRKECKKGTPWDELEMWADKSVRTNKGIKEALAKLAALPRDDDSQAWRDQFDALTDPLAEEGHGQDNSMWQNARDTMDDPEASDERKDTARKINDAFSEVDRRSQLAHQWGQDNPGRVAKFESHGFRFAPETGSVNFTKTDDNGWKHNIHPNSRQPEYGPGETEEGVGWTITADHPANFGHGLGPDLMRAEAGRTVTHSARTGHPDDDDDLALQRHGHMLEHSDFISNGWEPLRHSGEYEKKDVDGTKHVAFPNRRLEPVGSGYSPIIHERPGWNVNTTTFASPGDRVGKTTQAQHPTHLDAIMAHHGGQSPLGPKLAMPGKVTPQKAYPLIRDLINAGRPQFDIRTLAQVDPAHHDMITGSERPFYYEENDPDPNLPKIYTHRYKGRSIRFLAPLVHKQTGQTGWVRGLSDEDPSQWRLYRDSEIANAVAGSPVERMRSKVPLDENHRPIYGPRGDARYERQWARGTPPSEPEWQEGDVPLDEEGHQLVEPRRDYVTEPQGRYPWDFDWDKPGDHPLTERDDEWWRAPSL